MKRSLALAFVAALPFEAAADEKQTGLWLSDCNDKHCVFRQAPEETGERFAQFEVVIAKESGEASMLITAPLGIATGPGIRVIVVNKEWSVPIQVCQQDGCRASAPMSATDLGTLMQTKDLEIRFLPYGSDRPASVDIDISGLIAAISAEI